MSLRNARGFTLVELLVVMAHAVEFPDVTGRRFAGFLGRQNHREEVWYCNIRVGASHLTESAAVVKE